MNAEKSISTAWGFEYAMKNRKGQSDLAGLKDLDSQAISAVYDRYFADVYRFAYYRLNDEKAAEDIASEVFVRLLEAASKRRGPQTNLKGWLLSTASHAVTDHFRQAYKHPKEALSDLIPNGTAPSLTDEIDHRERVQTVQQAYLQLTAEQQTVLALRFGNGYSLDETARLLQKNVNAVKALQFRALAAIQQMAGEAAYE
jgi:RNA polymerase sigma-70 factor (ECF subfamily)